MEICLSPDMQATQNRIPYNQYIPLKQTILYLFFYLTAQQTLQVHIAATTYSFHRSQTFAFSPLIAHFHGSLLYIFSIDPSISLGDFPYNSSFYDSLYSSPSTLHTYPAHSCASAIRQYIWLFSFHAYFFGPHFVFFVLSCFHICINWAKYFFKVYFFLMYLLNLE